MMNKLILMVFLAAGLSGTASAQSVLKNHDTYQPLDISAERLEMQQKQGRAIFSGAVLVTQGKLTLRSDTITVFYALENQGGDPSISRLDAQGQFELMSESETLLGDWGIYDVDRQLVTVGGDVVFKQGNSELKGSRLEFDLVSGLAKLDGEDTTDESGRVRGSFTVPNQPDGR
ncbi:MAG: hypothetical protein JJ850_04300 [Kordiimonadaceae bacterium]|nr:hypothetical protein [Kordiimonadaceae bacterium]MBO6568461.1 hypothetical protein [Kordiimonadaceae bacterium]MBO6963810.1 hypothetical protein [Kordiimonadaceae bacterium]